MHHPGVPVVVEAALLPRSSSNNSNTNGNNSGNNDDNSKVVVIVIVVNAARGRAPARVRARLPVPARAGNAAVAPHACAVLVECGEVDRPDGSE